jgi:hypothetical protein
MDFPNDMLVVSAVVGKKQLSRCSIKAWTHARGRGSARIIRRRARQRRVLVPKCGGMRANLSLNPDASPGGAYAFWQRGPGSDDA